MSSKLAGGGSLVERTEAGVRAVEALAPYTRAWEKLRQAYLKRIEAMTSTELTELVGHCRAGRTALTLTGEEYHSSVEVERLARQILNQREAHSGNN